MKVQALRSFETSETAYPATQRNILEDLNLTKLYLYLAENILY
jgi:hypothetical protein